MGMPLSKIASKKEEDAGGVGVVLDDVEKAQLEQDIQKNAPRVI